MERMRDAYLDKREAILNDYFPLDIGNTWSYVKTVPEGAEVHFFLSQWIKVPSPESPAKGKHIFNFKKTDKMPEVSEETYTIIGTKKGYRKVEVRGDCPRDGRYSSEFVIPSEEGKNTYIYWLKVHHRFIKESLDGIYLGAKTKNSMIFMVPPKERFYTLPPIESNRVTDTFSYTSYESPLHFEIRSGFHNDEIKVPAGTFSNCLKNCTTFHEESVRDELRRGKLEPGSERDLIIFKTESFYSKGVGLVREVQYDPKGEINYALDLKSFDVKESK